MTDGERQQLRQTLSSLAEHGEFEVDVPSPAGGRDASAVDRNRVERPLPGPDAEVTSDHVDVETPAGRLAFEALPPEDYGAEHDRHDPDEGVYVNMWFVEGYTVVHVQDGTGEATTHTMEVHEQRPEERAIELEAHGIPERRAEIAALREAGLTYSEIVEATGAEGPNHRGDVSTHLQRYNEQIHQARWLAENAPPVPLGRRSRSGENGT